ncbi:hypothetical protein F5144DRAFT_109514 [Chaetomium tenue]|uniref:Uncharacterized protein n=1 Tax=Chaetomium tenue TaxID=1854479 RepID=A0ACB7PLW1_9PEZI|nr:hypothetical protein F5144DRAFT_109514 [Chaetomium globosum]
MAKRTPAVRSRIPFHYPSDDDDDTAEILDEQEQETLITTLTTQNNARNATTHRLLYVLPALSAIPFLLDLVLPPPTQPHRLLPLLGLSSLAATGLLLARLGVTETGFAGLDALVESDSDSRSGSGSGSGSGYGYGAGKRKQRGGLLGSGAGDKSPLETYVPWLNVGLAVLALLTGMLQRVKMGPQAAGVNPLLLGALPGVVFAVIVGAKVAMAGIDPERELSRYKYGYKGA